MTDSIGLSSRQFLHKFQLDLAQEIIDRQYKLLPEVWNSYGKAGREKSVRDAGYFLTYLFESIEAADPALFVEYLEWARSLLSSIGLPDDTLLTTLKCTRAVLNERLPFAMLPEATAILNTGLRSLENPARPLSSYLAGEGPLQGLSRQFLDHLLKAERQEAIRLIQAEIEKGASVKDIYLNVFQQTQREIGRLWQTHQISVAQEHYCSAATQMAMSQLYANIFTGQQKDRSIVVCCVGGELHEIGARMVADFFEMEGWNTYFLGANTPTDSVKNTVIQRKADVLAISVTMTFHIDKAAELINAVRSDPACSARTRILVGGYPFNISQQLWEKIGADGYASDALSAIAEAYRVLS